MLSSVDIKQAIFSKLQAMTSELAITHCARFVTKKYTFSVESVTLIVQAAVNSQVLIKFAKDYGVASEKIL